MRRTIRRIIESAIWAALFLLMASRFPAEPVGESMTSDVNQSEVVSRWGGK